MRAMARRRHGALRKAILTSEYTQTDIADMMGVTLQAFNDWLSGRHPFRLRDCYKILDILKLDPNTLPFYFPPEDQR